MTRPDRQVACGGRHTCALTASGCVYAWGSNLHGQCGPAAAPMQDSATGAKAVVAHYTAPVSVGRQADYLWIRLLVCQLAHHTMSNKQMWMNDVCTLACQLADHYKCAASKCV